MLPTAKLRDLQVLHSCAQERSPSPSFSIPSPPFVCLPGMAPRAFFQLLSAVSCRLSARNPFIRNTYKKQAGGWAMLASRKLLRSSADRETQNTGHETRITEHGSRTTGHQRRALGTRCLPGTAQSAAISTCSSAPPVTGPLSLFTGAPCGISLANKFWLRSCTLPGSDAEPQLGRSLSAASSPPGPLRGRQPCL
jgi:hypothetical protein